MSRVSLVNPFSIAVLLTGVGLYFLFLNPPNTDLSVYGFAESVETEVNYNYPVEIVDILVRSGEPVDSGQALLRVVRRDPKPGLADQPYRIDELRAEEAAWRERQNQRLLSLATEERAELAEIDERITNLRQEIAYRQRLDEQLESVIVPEGSYQPLEEDLATLQNDRRRTFARFERERERIASEQSFGRAPYRQQIRRIQAEADYEAANAAQEILLTAPATGLIGSINCREGEFKSAYANLITFYEPQSELVRGYLHEDLPVSVQTGDRFIASSLHEDGPSYRGTVIGLGRRIVEIPERLRKFPEVKSYGREITVAIPPDNAFLQKEKVSLRYLGEGPVK